MVEYSTFWSSRLFTSLMFSIYTIVYELVTVTKAIFSIFRYSYAINTVIKQGMMSISYSLIWPTSENRRFERYLTCRGILC